MVDEVVEGVEFSPLEVKLEKIERIHEYPAPSQGANTGEPSPSNMGGPVIARNTHSVLSRLFGQHKDRFNANIESQRNQQALDPKGQSSAGSQPCSTKRAVTQLNNKKRMESSVTYNFIENFIPTADELRKGGLQVHTGPNTNSLNRNQYL